MHHYPDDDIIELPGDPRRSTGTPIRATANSSIAAGTSTPFPMNGRTPTQITPEGRARMEENRLRAEAIKANRLREAQNAQRAAEFEKKRTAGETWLTELGLNQKKNVSVSVPIKFNPTQKKPVTPDFERKRSEMGRQTSVEPVDQPYVPDPRCSAEQMRVLDEVRQHTIDEKFLNFGKLIS